MFDRRGSCWLWKFVAMVLLAQAPGSIALAGGLLHRHGVKYRVVQGYIVQPQTSSGTLVIRQGDVTPSTTPAEDSNAPLPSLKLALPQNQGSTLSASPQSLQKPSTPQSVTLQLLPAQPRTQTVTLQLAPAQPQTQTVTLQLAPAPTQSLQLSVVPMRAQTLQLQTLQLVPLQTQTLQLNQQPATQSMTVSPAQFLLPKHSWLHK